MNSTAKILRILICLSFLFLVCSVTGCSCLRRCPVPEQRDSTVIRYVDSLRIRDTLVYVNIPKESSSNEQFAMPSDTSHLETSVARSDAWVDSTGRLHHKLDNKSDMKLPAIVPIVDRARIMDRDFSHSLTITKTVEKPLSWWQRCFMTLGKIFVGALAAAAVLLVCKLFLKFGL